MLPSPGLALIDDAYFLAYFLKESLHVTCYMLQEIIATDGTRDNPAMTSGSALMSAPAVISIMTCAETSYKTL